MGLFTFDAKLSNLELDELFVFSSSSFSCSWFRYVFLSLRVECLRLWCEDEARDEVD